VPVDENQREQEKQSAFIPKAYISKDAPLSLGQMQHIAPKPFRRVKETVDLGEVRKILSSERTGKSDSEASHGAENVLP
jgi:hypothetical protein